MWEKECRKRKSIYCFKCSIALSSRFHSLLEWTWSEMVRLGDVHSKIIFWCEYHTWSGCFALILSERVSVASWERKQIYRFSNKIPFPIPFQLQDADSHFFTEISKIIYQLIRTNLCQDFQQEEGLCWVHQSRPCPYPRGVAFSWGWRNRRVCPSLQKCFSL